MLLYSCIFMEKEKKKEKSADHQAAQLDVVLV